MDISATQCWSHRLGEKWLPCLGWYKETQMETKLTLVSWFGFCFCFVALVVAADGGGSGHGVWPKSTGGGQNKLWSVSFIGILLPWDWVSHWIRTWPCRLGWLARELLGSGTTAMPGSLYRRWGFKVTSSSLESKCSYPLNHLPSPQKTEKTVTEDQMNNS